MKNTMFKRHDDPDKRNQTNNDLIEFIKQRNIERKEEEQRERSWKKAMTMQKKKLFKQIDSKIAIKQAVEEKRRKTAATQNYSDKELNNMF